MFLVLNSVRIMTIGVRNIRHHSDNIRNTSFYTHCQESDNPIISYQITHCQNIDNSTDSTPHRIRHHNDKGISFYILLYVKYCQHNDKSTEFSVLFRPFPFSLSPFSSFCFFSSLFSFPFPCLPFLTPFPPLPVLLLSSVFFSVFRAP